LSLSFFELKDSHRVGGRSGGEFVAHFAQLLLQLKHLLLNLLLFFGRNLFAGWRDRLVDISLIRSFGHKGMVTMFAANVLTQVFGAYAQVTPATGTGNVHEL
jgi:hypothetical protein